MTTATISRPNRERLSFAGSMKDARVDADRQLIRDFAVITEGEALGHDFWIDRAFLAQVVEGGNAKKLGVKVRFTHPGLCNDGLGKFLGRAKDYRLDGNIVRADLHVSELADESPDGKLGSYILRMADKEPDMFGASIVFYHDPDAEKEFAEENEDDDGDFVSPDEANEDDLMHARLDSLASTDVVDDPAANPGGFLSQPQELTALGELACRYVFGLRDAEPPADIFGGLKPQRVRKFITEFLIRNGLTISGDTPTAFSGDEDMADKKSLKEILVAMQQAFPEDADFALASAIGDLSVMEAKAAYCDKLQAELARVKTAGAEALKVQTVEVARLTEEHAGIRKELLAGSDGVQHVPEPDAVTKEAAIAAAEKVAEARVRAEPGIRYQDAYAEAYKVEIAKRPTLDGA